ncbi:hypothetical protein WR25_14228 [Diploscapter pachys]|uniref:Secreted protein n=1 Tax=Diploscapter pachys TaxID=2018661 RepID=A0A2A2KD32_9BILA|nr:hypothetical protein WR25_14228 [Diploscapter pachys]
MSVAAASIMACWSMLRPVVPMTIGVRVARAAATCASSAAGVEKSTRTSDICASARGSPPASTPPASRAPAASICSAIARPIRPLLP